MFLEEKEIIELTHKSRFSAQVTALRRMGIEHRVRPDGSLAVLRSHIENLLDGKTLENVRIEIQPNWDALNAKKKKPRK